MVLFFFFQAEDGIRDIGVTGVQTCALPIYRIRRKLSMPRSVIGMTVAHIGLGIFVLSVTTVESFTLERDVALGQGERTTVGNYEFRFQGVKPIEGPNYNGVEGTVVVTRHGVPRSVVYPQKRQDL